jgi:hypothetical protein
MKMLCAALLIAIPTIAQAGAGHFYCGDDFAITVNFGGKQNSVAIMGKGKERDRLLGTFPSKQRYVRISTPAILGGLELLVDTKDHKVTFNGKPCEMGGAQEISQSQKTLTMYAIIEVYHNNCGGAFREQRDRDFFVGFGKRHFDEATLTDALVQTENNRKKFGAEKFCSTFKSSVEQFRVPK